MEYREVLYTVSEKVACLILNRPDRLNAWTPRMSLEVMDAIHAEPTVLADQLLVQSLESEDAKEGVAHFLEKYPPNFTGR